MGFISGGFSCRRSQVRPEPGGVTFSGSLLLLRCCLQNPFLPKTRKTQAYHLPPESATLQPCLLLAPGNASFRTAVSGVFCATRIILLPSRRYCVFAQASANSVSTNFSMRRDGREADRGWKGGLRVTILRYCCGYKQVVYSLR